jgi:hypothetical protein
LYSNESSVLGLATCHGSAHSTKPERGGQLATDELVLLHSNRVRPPSLNAHNSVCHIACSSILFLTDNRGSKRFSDRAGSRVARQLPPPTPTPTPHTHTHPGALVPRFNRFTHKQHTLGLALQQARRGPSTTPQQDAAPRQRHSKQDAGAQLLDAGPERKTFLPMTRQGTRSTRRGSFRRPASSPCRFCHYSISTWFFSSFS